MIDFLYKSQVQISQIRNLYRAHIWCEVIMKLFIFILKVKGHSKV